jgi:hypothetical protein
MVNMMRKSNLSLDNPWMGFYDARARTGGPIVWARGAAPRYVEFIGRWPLIGLRFSPTRDAAALQSGLQLRKQSWHAWVPRDRLGVPRTFRLDADSSRQLAREDGEGGYVFDFTGMAPLPPNDLDCRFLAIVEELKNFLTYHPEVPARLGIDVNVQLRPSPED